MNCVRVQKNTV